MTSSKNFRDKFAICGYGITKQGYLPEYTARSLEAEAARLAIEDAGLEREDIDGCIHCRMTGGAGSGIDWEDAFPRILGLPAKFYQPIGRGGTSATMSILVATQVLDLGLSNYVLVAISLNTLSQARKRARQGEKSIPLGGKEAFGKELGDLAPVSHHAFFASCHMKQYGTTSRQLGAVAVAQRSWACLNPDAYMYNRPITVEDHQKSPVLVWPYHLLDMCLMTDGGAAFVVTTAERAKDLRKPPVYIMGLGFGEAMERLWWEKTNYTRLAVKSAKEDAFRLAGIELNDIDIAQLYDCFTGEIILQLEDYGWCKKGEGGPFAEAGNTGPGGFIPVNTGGGQLSSHYLIDFTQFGEAIVQLRGEGKTRQIKDAEVCLVSGHGGEILRPGMCSIHSTLILRR